MTKDCFNCRKSYHNNETGDLCYEDCRNQELWKPIPEYPKEATFMEAVSWMEQGNKAEYNDSTFYTDDWIRWKFDDSKMVITVKAIKGTWKLLPPEKGPTEDTVELINQVILDMEKHIEVMKKLKERA
jgi:hypothetical protein